MLTRKVLPDASESHLGVTSLYFTPVPSVSAAKPVALLENATGCDQSGWCSRLLWKVVCV